MSNDLLEELSFALISQKIDLSSHGRIRTVRKSKGAGQRAGSGCLIFLHRARVARQGVSFADHHDMAERTGTDRRIGGVVALANGMRRAVLDLSGGISAAASAVRRPRTRSPRHDGASAERLDDPKSGLPDPGRKIP